MLQLSLDMALIVVFVALSTIQYNELLYDYKRNTCGLLVYENILFFW